MKTLTLPEQTLINQNDEDEIDLRVYWQIFNKYRWQIFRLTFFIGLLAFLITLSMKPSYRFTTTLLIELEQAKVISIEEVYGINSSNQDYYQTQLGILKSRKLVEKIVKKLNLMAHPIFNVAPKNASWWHHWFPPDKATDEEKFNQIVDSVMEQLSISAERNSQLVKISFESHDAQLAADIPNTLANIYIESDLEARLEMTQKAAYWLTERVDGLRQKLRKSEQALQNYMERQNLVDVAGIKSVATKKVEETASNLMKADQQLTEAKNIYKQVQAIRGRSTTAFESIPAVLRQPLVQNLKKAELEAESKVSEISKRYKSKHPKMIAARAELKTARNNTAEQIQRVIEGITKEYEVAQANVNVLKLSMKRQEQDIQKINRKEYQLKVLEREVSVNQQLYDLFLTRFKETEASRDVQGLQSTIGRIVDLAVVRPFPYKPKKKLIVSISLVLGFLFATFLAFLIEYFDNTIKNAEDVEQKLESPFLGFLPKIKISKKNPLKAQWMFLLEPKSHFSESVRTIRTGVTLSCIDTPRKILVVTSSVAGEGKTTFAINQAFALGQVEKTLLIDADMRRPSIGKAFGLTAKAPGLSELVAGTRPLHECIHHLEKETGVDFIPSGVIPPNPLELLASKRFKKILTQLEEQDDYEHIIIDSAPTLFVSDALILAKQASGIIYVVKADVTPYQIILKNLNRLHELDTKILGIVLNQVDIKKLSKHYGNQYSYYGEQYQDYSQGYYS
ncbi:polysaccharide biosynthesis tyrosine autokinase [Candidatus Parabeggiatoa sp. HSG14]|uniref:GumC family protein n=1 Tax=Candidatus Parabeggiatoa sp. HSG14 TaxID=3055593 RepID=UPI0025A6EFD7|nr:polysaccharide biosynthesis tyrosine autokinase [Thiotrichales bacterium HSG14]